MSTDGQTTKSAASKMLAAHLDDERPPTAAPSRLSPVVVAPASELAVRAEMAWRAMVTMHAMELLQLERFRRTGQITPRQVHQIAQDHLALRRPADDLDATVQAVLERADELQRARTGQNVGVIA